MWFVLGMVCGLAVSLCLRKRRSSVAEKRSEPTASTPTKAWGETHNFLYYDGTVMPEIKEVLNE